MRLLSALLLWPAFAAAAADHHALEATLHAAAGPGGAELGVAALFPGAPRGTRVYWRVEVQAPAGADLGTLRGELLLSAEERARTRVDWPLAPHPAGVYGFKLRATAIEPWMQARIQAADAAARVERALAFAPNGVVEQEWPLALGGPAAVAMPEFAGLPTASQRAIDPPAGLPYRIYLANLHSQSNHSDGGGNVATCSSSQGAQSGEFGPGDAYAYARTHGLDALMVSEHNHYFDGSSGTNAGANPATAIALYQSGVQAALAHNLAHPDFLALYGMEWGVISNGGHLNILGGNQLFGWEYNAAQQLLAEVHTARSDYAPLYALMRQNGLVGQFNHPDTSGQFVIDGVALAWHADGDEVMLLSEVLNTSAFSNDTTESETSRSSYVGAWNRLLERGWHVAPASNQDNHCANWGMSYTNRTGVLIPADQALSPQSFLEALRARRVYATMDRSSQILLRANGRLMGERFVNQGPLELEVLFASSGGHSVSEVRIYEGVPGRNGTVSILTSTPTHSFTPDPGAHFYYARIVQEDADLLWSAPVWVQQLGPLLRDGFE